MLETADCVRLRSSRPQVISLSALKKWELWSVRTWDTSLRADNFWRVAHRRAAFEWDPHGRPSTQKIRARAYGLSDAPVPLHGYVFCVKGPLPSAPASSFSSNAGWSGGRHYRTYRRHPWKRRAGSLQTGSALSRTPLRGDPKSKRRSSRT